MTGTIMRPLPVRLLLAGLLLSASAAIARPDLPPEDKVMEALDNHPDVASAAAMASAARAHADMLDRGSHEITLSGTYSRRSIDREGRFNEFDGSATRAFRLPGKAALDREAGRLGVEAADNRTADARHQTALLLSGFWHDWLAAGALHANDGEAVKWSEAALKAVRRRTEMRDASSLDIDLATAALAEAQARAADSLALREHARALLAASFPEIPLPASPPELYLPELPPQDLQSLRDQVIENSHEIRAAEREAERMGVVARRASADRIADPSFGVRLFSERGGEERGAGLIASIPLGGGYRRAASDQAAAEANAARMGLVAAIRATTATADSDLTNARMRLDGWRRAQESAAAATEAERRTERGYQLGEIDLADLLISRRLAGDARRAEILARSEADRALLKIRIDSHSIWSAHVEHDH